MTPEEWDQAYDDAMAWRDWQTCVILLEQRDQEDWWKDNRDPGDETDSK